MKQKKEKKAKKEKITYVDDGSRIADMSFLDPAPRRDPMADIDKKPRPRWRQIIDTYFDSMKMMLLPTLVIVGLIAVAFAVIWLIFWLSA